MQFKNPNNVQIGASKKDKRYDAKGRRREILQACAEADANGVLESKVSMCADDTKLIRGMLKEKVIRSEVGSGPKNGFHNRLHLTEVGLEELGGKALHR